MISTAPSSSSSSPSSSCWKLEVVLKKDWSLRVFCQWTKKQSANHTKSNLLQRIPFFQEISKFTDQITLDSDDLRFTRVHPFPYNFKLVWCSLEEEERFFLSTISATTSHVVMIWAPPRVYPFPYNFKLIYSSMEEEEFFFWVINSATTYFQLKKKSI
jgi:hypothetical protein